MNKYFGKKQFYQVFKSSRGKITRYYSPMVSPDDFLTIGYLKNDNPCNILLFFFYSNNSPDFKEIKLEIKKAPSTTSWNFNLLEDEIIVKPKSEKKLSVIFP